MSGRIHLAHGASGTASSMQPWVDALLARGLEATTVQLPRTRAERAVAAYAAAVPSGHRDVIGGHSFGGRVASLLAADEPYAALVLLSYPLHPPGRGELWEARTQHWPRIDCPVLLLSGDRDPFARIDLLRGAVDRLPDGRLEVFSGQRHGLGPVRAAAVDAIVTFLRGAVGPDADLG